MRSGNRGQRKTNGPVRQSSRLPVRGLLILTVSLLSASCAFRRPQAFADQAVQELSRLHIGGTVGEWMAESPDSELAFYSLEHGIAAGPTWCARTFGRVILRDGSELQRGALFYPPEPQPDGRLLAPGDSASDVLGECTIALAWVQVQEGDSAEAVRLVSEGRSGGRGKRKS